MREDILVSIGLPFLNPGRHIQYSIASILNQSYSNLELILVNDGSNDDSVELVRSIKDPRIRFIDDSTNIGLPRRLNQICDIANGEYLARMDADDMMHPHRIRRQLEYFLENPGIDVVDTAAYIIDEENRPIGIIGHKNKNASQGINALKWGRVLHPSVMARKRWFAENRYSNNYPRAEDRELFIRSYHETVIGHIRDPLLFYRRGQICIHAALEGYRSERRVIRFYGKQLIGPCSSVYLLIRSYGKSISLVVLKHIGKEGLAIGRMYEPIETAVALQASSIIDSIASKLI